MIVFQAGAKTTTHGLEIARHMRTTPTATNPGQLPPGPRKKRVAWVLFYERGAISVIVMTEIWWPRPLFWPRACDVRVSMYVHVPWPHFWKISLRFGAVILAGFGKQLGLIKHPGIGLTIGPNGTPEWAGISFPAPPCQPNDHAKLLQPLKRFSHMQHLSFICFCFKCSHVFGIWGSNGWIERGAVGKASRVARRRYGAFAKFSTRINLTIITSAHTHTLANTEPPHARALGLLYGAIQWDKYAGFRIF